MDGDRFDDIARAMAGGLSRRRLLGGLAAVLGLVGSNQALTASCRTGGRTCREDANCCSGVCHPSDDTGRRRCAAVCPNGQVPCNGACVDTDRDPQHCGQCGAACPAGDACNRIECKGGRCRTTKVACNDRNPCTANGCDPVAGCVFTPVADGQQGGCDAGKVCCAGAGCVRLGDNTNCGFCGDACVGGATCGGGGTPGVCGCTDDGRACADRVCGTAVNNCGQTVDCGPLGGDCPAGQSCSGAGTCACPAGTCGEGCALAVCADQACKQGAGGACAADGDCCSGVCLAGSCLGGCVAEGGVCDSGADCCAGACVTPGGGGTTQRCCASGVACGSACCAAATQVCDLTGACCTPAVCAPGQCGPHPNGCGGSIDCGGCAGTETCGGGGTPGVCGSCTPEPAAATCAGKCRTVVNNCGQSVDCTAQCAGCCTVAVNSVCKPGDANTACGLNGANCHICLPPDTCGGAADAGICGCTSAPLATTCAGKCGAVLDNCGQEVTCPGCPSGQDCCGGVCRDLRSDDAHCGTCGRACVGDQASCLSARCVGGTCVFSTVANCCQRDDECGDANPCTVSTCDPVTFTCRHDPVADNTGCGGGRVCCDGDCLDVWGDAANCGACGNVCVANQPGPGGGCQTGSCSFNTCDTAVTICGSCATPSCDPERGGICVSTCPPPSDACHTGPGVCQLDGTCTYQSVCGPCQTCDPSGGTCSPKVCRACETCDPSSGQCVSACGSPPDACHTAPGICNDDGACSYPTVDCGPCKRCLVNVPGPGYACSGFGVENGTSCGLCRECQGGECVRQSPGVSCGACQVCTESGTCQFAADGTSCGICRACTAGGCGFAAQGTHCGDDGYICDGVGSCVCALTCSGRCCPGNSKTCCGSGTIGVDVCCTQDCIVTGPATVCPD